MRDPWAAEERVSGCVIVGDRSSTCLRCTFVRGVRFESALYARYLPGCLRAGHGLFCVHDSVNVPFIRLSVSRRASGLLRCVSSALHFSSVGASVHSSVSARAVPAKLSLQEGTIRGANLACGLAPLAVSAVSRPVLASMPIMCTALRPLSTGGHVQMESA